METKSKTCYQLWGNDNFSNEEYLCGVYTHYSSAWRSKKRHEQETMESQSDGLRDNYWIVKTTIEKHNDMMRKRFAKIDAVHNNIIKAKSIVEDTIPAMEEFIKMCIVEGVYEYPLPDSFGETCIMGVNFTLKRRNKREDEYKFAICISVGENDELRSESLISLAYGTREKVNAAIRSESFRSEMISFFYSVIEKYYFEQLDYY